MNKSNHCKGVPFETTVVAWVASKMAHAKPIQTTIPFAWVFGYALANGPIGLFGTQTDILETSIQ